MKVLIDIPDPIIPVLASLCAEEKISRSEAIRCAIKQYVEARSAKEKPAKGLMEHFGAWKGTSSECDGLELQRRLRAEWEHRDSGL